MSILVIGPSSVGKSTYINILINKKIISKNDVFFGTQIKQFLFSKKLTKVLHYNLLHYMLTNANNFVTEKIFLKIIRNKPFFKDVVILVAPIKDIFFRVKTRLYVEEKTSKYNNNLWFKIYEKVNLFKVYEDLFKLFDTEKINYRVLFSSNKSFKITDRVFVHHNLLGKYFELPNKDQVSDLMKKKELHYQSVILPYNNKSYSGYGHIPENRDNSFLPLLDQDLRNKSVLDIGAAIGNFLFIAERYGANRLYGIEMNKSRYNGATMIGNILNSNTRFFNTSFNKDLFKEQLDFVLCLNVIHHIDDYKNFLFDCANLTKEMLVLEFPTFLDPKFISFKKISKEEAIKLNNRSLVDKCFNNKKTNYHQTYVFSPEFITNILMNNNLGFKSYNTYNSTIKGRIIISFSKKLD